MPGPASQVVHNRVSFAINYVLGLFPLCRGLPAEKKRMNSNCDLCQEMCSQWHFTSRNAQILHVLQLLQYYLHLKMEKWRNQRHCLKCPALNSSFCSSLQKSKRQMEKTACRHTNNVLVLTTATCCQTLSLVHLQPSDVCDTMPVLQSCPSSYSTTPWSFKSIGFGDNTCRQKCQKCQWFFWSLFGVSFLFFALVCVLKTEQIKG